MTAKEFLQQVQRYNDRIREQEEYIQRLRDSLGIAGLRYDKDRVNTSPDPDQIADVMSKIFEQERILSDMKHDAMVFRIKIIDMIHQLDDNKHKQILNLVYIDGNKLMKCADLMGYSYDYIKELHGEALKAFGEKFPLQST